MSNVIHEAAVSMDACEHIAKALRTRAISGAAAHTLESLPSLEELIGTAKAALLSLQTRRIRESPRTTQDRFLCDLKQVASCVNQQIAKHIHERKHPRVEPTGAAAVAVQEEWMAMSQYEKEIKTNVSRNHEELRRRGLL